MVRLQGHLEVVVVEARNLSSRSVINPYCIVELVGTKSTHEIGKTATIEDHYNPKWLSTISADIDQDLLEIRFIVKDKSLFKDEKLGNCSLNASNISADTYTVTLDLCKKQNNAGQLNVKVKLHELSAPGTTRRMSKAEKSKGCVPRKVDLESNFHTVFLHGKLTVCVKRAENLPNLDSSLLSRKNKSDPFVVIELQDAHGDLLKLATTETIDNNLSPEWNEKFIIDVCHDVANVVLVVYDEDVVKHDKMCSLDIPVRDIENGQLVEGERTLYKHKTKEAGKLTTSIQYIKKSDQKSFTVQNCVFPVRSENKVKLYQDAHCSSLPAVIRDYGGRSYTPKHAWEDIYNTLNGAKKFICIAGWNLNASIVLFRSDCGNGDTIGKVLLDRADEGVDVRVLLWDEAESSDAKKDTAKEFFKESLVKVDVVSRKKPRRDVFHRDGAHVRYSFSHNQKFIVADDSVEGSPGLRNVVAYVGAFDLTSGRYDTSEHKLYNNDESENKSPFYNNIIATITRSNSRIPWHDVLCKVIGSAALDIYQNFQSRWETEAQVAESDYNMEKADGLYRNYEYDALDSWDVQCFRSVAEDSVQLDASDNIFTYAGTRVENSVQRAYIHQIQKARQFIYLETTNIIGSSHFWEDCADIHCRNLIPIEIATKIIEKIRQDKSFTTYVVLSMHPENSPDDMYSQEILHWQYHTIEMMYRRIGKAIQEKGSDAHPSDYLLFLCLGKREETDATPKLLKQLSEEGPLPNLTKQKRSMIAVNSKLAIFDDEYMIVGSGNITDRSLVGNRNTELAIGAHQPRVGAVGDVSTFRKCLWSEHLGSDAPLDMNPSSVECSRKIHEIADHNLKAFLDTSLPVPKSHLLLYPIWVTKSGNVSHLNDCEKFPDTKAYVLGMRSKVIPDSLTT